MRWLKLIAFLFLLSAFFGAALLLHLAISLLRLKERWRIVSKLTRLFALSLRMLFNIKIALEGDLQGAKSGGRFIVCNHLGYVDGFILGSLSPVIYVSKKEVRRWPLIGQWTALCGTVFIDRQHKDKIPLTVEEIAAKLRQGANILLFPEGTSTNGERLLPFQSAPFAAALRAKSPILPVTLTYKRIDREPVSPTNRDKIYWYGEMEFVDHFWDLLALRSIEVSVKIHPEIETANYRNTSLSRKQLSQTCHDIISGKLKRREPRKALL